MLEIEGLRVSYGHLEVLHGIDLHVGDGEFVALLGSNGAGKTTLLNTCSALLAPRAGSIRFDGKEIGGVRPHKLPELGLGHAMGGHWIFHRQSVEANLALGAYVNGGKNRKTLADFGRVYELFPVLKTKAHRPASTLSGGERQMLAIGQALMARPKVLLLDEPSSGLAPRLVTEVFRVLRQLKSEGMGMLLAEQTVEQALLVCDRAYVLEAGAIALSGQAAELRGNPAVQAVYIGSLGLLATGEAEAGPAGLPLDGAEPVQPRSDATG